MEGSGALNGLPSATAQPKYSSLLKFSVLPAEGWFGAAKTVGGAVPKPTGAP